MSNKNELNEEEKIEKNEPDTEKSDNNKKILIAEIAIVIIAVIAIIFALVVNRGNSDSASDNNVTSQNTITTPSTTGTAVVDNSIIYELPAYPTVDEFNTLTEEECEANVAAGTMLKLDCSDGSYIYVNNYTDTAYFAESTSYTQEEIDEYVFADILSMYGTTVETDRTVAQNWDTVSINFVGYLDGEAFEGGSSEDYMLTIGAGGFVEGFESGIIGMTEGETKDVVLTFPEDYYEDLAGQEVTFTITLNDVISETTFPELTDEMVQEASGGAFATVSECNAYYEEILLQDKIWTFIDTNFYTSALPEEVINNYYNTTMEYYDAISTSQQLSIETMLSYYGLTLDVFKQDVILTAAESARYSSLYQAIAAANGIEVTDEDIAALAADYSYTDTTLFIADYGEQSVMDYILQSKVMDYLVSLRPAE